MKHKHHYLIAQWNEDTSVEFEFAYGTGVDFIWADCDISHVINNPSVQIRIKASKPKKEKRWVATIDGLLSPSAVFDDKSKLESKLKGMSYQIHEIHVEV